MQPAAKAHRYITKPKPSPGNMWDLSKASRLDIVAKLHKHLADYLDNLGELTNEDVVNLRKELNRFFELRPDPPKIAGHYWAKFVDDTDFEIVEYDFDDDNIQGQSNFRITRIGDATQYGLSDIAEWGSRVFRNK